MKKSDFIFGLVLLFLAIPTFARENLQQRVVDKTKYIDQYFEVNNNGQERMHIFLNGEKILSVDGENEYFPISDHLGSPTIITDQNAEVVESNDYGDYGQLIQQDGGVSDYKFSDKELDQETGLQYFTNRYYDSQTANFVSIDPALIQNPGEFLFDPQQLNSYAYARNNPILFIDPSGLTTKVYLEKGNIKDGIESMFGHAFLAIDGTVYNWAPNVGREYHGNDFNGEDIDITSWHTFVARADKKDDSYNVYTFDTSDEQEASIRRFYLDLGRKNNAQSGDDRTTFNVLGYNCTDVVADALRSGGVLSEKFKLGGLVSRPGQLKSEFNKKYALQNEKSNLLHYMKQKFYNTRRNQVLLNISNKSIIKPDEN